QPRHRGRDDPGAEGGGQGDRRHLSRRGGPRPRLRPDIRDRAIQGGGMNTELILTNVRIVTRDSVIHGAARIAGDRIAEVSGTPSRAPGALDLDGDYLLPGLVELHTDNMEKHFEPRPNAFWPSPLAAALAHDTQIIGAGITTVLDAVCIGDYRDAGKRRRILADSIGSITTARAADLLRADHLFHLRCETSDPNVVEM